MTTLSMSSNPVFFFNAARNLIHGELLYQVIHGLQRRRIFEQASRAKCVATCVWLWK